MHGWIFLDKPVGISSNHTLSRVKRLLGQRKAGFSGTLDPLASGVLPIALGEALKTMQYMTFSTKEYVFEITFGEERDTGDAEGAVTHTSTHFPTSIGIQAALSKFIGEITQIPPRYSAIKIQGRRACDRTRDGEIVEIPERKVTIHTLMLESFDQTLKDAGGGTEVCAGVCKATLRVECSAGTYVRTLAQDISRFLGTVGYVSKLRRTAVGAFREDLTITLEKMEEIVHSNPDFLPLKSMGIGLDDILAVSVTWENYQDLLKGRFTYVDASDRNVETVQILVEGECAGFASLEQGWLKPKRIIHQQKVL